MNREELIQAVLEAGVNGFVVFLLVWSTMSQTAGFIEAAQPALSIAGIRIAVYLQQNLDYVSSQGVQKQLPGRSQKIVQGLGKVI